MNRTLRKQLVTEMQEINEKIKYECNGKKRGRLINKLSKVQVIYWDNNPTESEFAKDFMGMLVNAGFFYHMVVTPIGEQNIPILKVK